MPAIEGGLRAEYRRAIADGSRPCCVLGGLLAPIAPAAHGGSWPSAQAPDAFRRFLEALWPEAQAMGVSRATFDAALRGVEPDLALPDLVLPGKSEVKGQAEFTRTPAQYLSATYLAKLTEQGRALQTQHADVARQDRDASSACSASSCSPSGAGRRRSARTSRPTTSSRRSPPRPISAAARTCSAPSCSTR